MQVDFNPDVVARYRLIGYENRAVADQDFRNDSVDAGEIGAGHSATAALCGACSARQPGADRHRAAALAGPRDLRRCSEINGNFNTWDLAQNFEDTAPRYQLAVVAGSTPRCCARAPGHSRPACHSSITSPVACWKPCPKTPM